MPTPFAAIDELISKSCMQALADAEVTRASGMPFMAQHDIADEQAFDMRAIASDEQITYRRIDAPDLAPNEAITINGVGYRVSGDPRQINAQEYVAQVVKT